MTTGMFMVEVYCKKARQINAQDPAHRRAYILIIAKTAGYQRKIIFHTFKYIFYNSVCLSFTRIFVVIVLF